MDNKKYTQSNNYNEEITILQNIINTLETTDNKTFKEHITLYGTINYTRTQYLTQLSKKITEQEDNQHIFYNYTSLESMILDLLNVIESRTIKTIETQPQETNEMLNFTIKLLKILEETLEKQENTKEITQKISRIQNDYYKQIYDEKSDIRIK